MEEVSNGEIYRLLLEVRSDVKQQNGRVNQHSTDIALLKFEQGTLKDGHATLRDDAMTRGRNWGAGTGAAGGFIGGFLAAFVEKWTRP